MFWEEGDRLGIGYIVLKVEFLRINDYKVSEIKILSEVESWRNRSINLVVENEFYGVIEGEL